MISGRPELINLQNYLLLFMNAILKHSSAVLQKFEFQSAKLQKYYQSKL